MIRYQVIQSNRNFSDEEEGPDTTSLTVYFASGKILSITDRKDDYQTTLIRLDSLKIYSIEKEQKIFSVKRMLKLSQQKYPEKENILGYTASVLNSPYSVLLNMPGDVYLLIADSLFYHIPSGLEKNEALAMLADNRILLKAVVQLSPFSIDAYSEEEEKEANKYSSTILLNAEEIKPGKIDPAVFEIPSGFKERSPSWEKESEIESAAPDTVAIPDSAAIKPTTSLNKPDKEKPLKKPVTATKQKSPAKKD